MLAETPFVEALRAHSQFDCTLPKWMSEVKCKCTTFGDLSALKHHLAAQAGIGAVVRDFKTDVDLLASKFAVGALLKPGDFMRPDGILPLEDTAGRRYYIVIGSAWYTQVVPTAKVQSQKQSSDLRYCYSKADSKDVNPQAKTLFDDYKRRILDNEILRPHGCLRIHFVIPRASKLKPPLPLCSTNGNDVIVNITAKTANLMWPPEKYPDLLKIIDDLSEGTSHHPVIFIDVISVLPFLTSLRYVVQPDNGPSQPHSFLGNDDSTGSYDNDERSSAGFDIQRND